MDTFVRVGLGQQLADWLVFQNLVARNYLHHREIIRKLAAWTKDRNPQGMRVLDLGCGDGYVARRAFRGVDDMQYFGIDLSAHALGVARSNLESKLWNIELLEGDFRRMIQQLHGPFDLVIAGFSMHLMDECQQANVLDQIRLILNPMGSLVIFDLMPRKGESSPDFTSRLLRDARSKWNHLETEQMDTFHKYLDDCNHVLDQTAWQAYALQSSLGPAELIYRDDSEHVGMLKF